MLEQFKRINKTVGLGIFIDADGSASFSVCGIAINNRQLNIVQKAESIGSLRELREVLPERTLLALNFNGRGVLYKQAAKMEGLTASDFSRILPNANLEDFYIQHFISGGQSFISMIRKSEADKWIKQLTSLGYIPLMVTLGPFPAANILAQLNFYEPTVMFDGYKIERNEQGDWLNWSYDPAQVAQYPVKLQTEQIAERLVLPYASAFGLALSDQAEPIRADCESLAAALDDLLKTRKLKQQGAVVLFLFFLLLLINFGILTWLTAENGSLAEKVSRTAQSNADLQKTGDEIDQKTLLLKKLGWESGINKSALIDQVASLLPREITWEEVSVDPVDLTAPGQEKAIVFLVNTIRIAGTSATIIPVNEWIARIKTRPWVKNAELDNYSFNSDLNTGQFTLVIHY